MPVAKIEMTDERTRNKSVTHASSEEGLAVEKAHSDKSSVYCHTEPAYDYTSMDLE